MDWSTKRKVTYGVATIFFIFAIGAYLFQNVLFPEPTCFDVKQNGFEVGVDCGGECALRCTSEIVPIKVTWARALSVGNNRYDLVGLVENKNIDNTPKEIGYKFSVFGKDGAEIFVYTGTTTISVEDEKPIIVSNKLVNGTPDKTTLTIFPAQHFTANEKPKSPLVRTLRVRHEDGDIPRVYVTLKNMTQKSFADLPVRVVLYDSNRNAIAAGETLIKSLNPEAEPEIVFTWNERFSSPVASTVVYYDFKSF
ncbi:MAG: hypothetical protein QG653_519 [Patescibacteria group bacterium]|nr:hypothetical protein [Patescibacteria group bacterium]